MNPKMKGNRTEREEPAPPKSKVPEHHTREWEIRVRQEALKAAMHDRSTGRRAGLPSSR